jgi:hypothetical protein
MNGNGSEVGIMLQPRTGYGDDACQRVNGAIRAADVRTKSTWVLLVA